MKRFLIFVLALSVVCFSSTLLQAGDLSSKIGIGVKAGGLKLGLTDHTDIWTVGPLGRVELKFGLHEKWMLGLMGTYGIVWEADLGGKTDGAGLTFSAAPDAGKLKSYLVDLAGFYYFSPQKKLSPYALFGLGLDTWVTETKEGGGVYKLDKKGNLFRWRDQQLTFVLGGGVEYFVNDNFSFGGDLRFHYLTKGFSGLTDNKDVGGKDWYDIPKGIFEISGGFTYYYEFKKDSDKDGVPDHLDKCPDTPFGCLVDESGCPLDKDKDGVCDGLDKCPDTKPGCKVDLTGCPIDSDGDGVCDGVDRCPDTPKGMQVDATGCPQDSDGDGVPDIDDKCPNTPRGCKVDKDGCPMDSDGDGVCDGVDKCPDTPKGQFVDATGCLDVSKYKLENVHFATLKHDLTKEAKDILDIIFDHLKTNPWMKLSIEGHADSTGNDAINDPLSKRRAESAKNYLAKKGVSEDRLEARSFGSKKPIASNATLEGRQKNRRVEFKIVK